MVHMKGLVPFSVYTQGDLSKEHDWLIWLQGLVLQTVQTTSPMNSNQFETVVQVAGANIWSLGLCFFFGKLKCTVTVQKKIYNNYQNSCTLISLQLLSIRVQTIKIMSDVVCTLSQ